MAPVWTEGFGFCHFMPGHRQPLGVFHGISAGIFMKKKKQNPTNQTIANNGRDIRMYLKAFFAVF